MYRTILHKLRRRFGSITEAARAFNTSREMVYQAARGRGSKALRVSICKALSMNPLELWPGHVLDEKLWLAEMGLERAEMDTPWLDAKEAARYLRFQSLKTFQNHVSKNAIPHCVEPKTGIKRFHREVLNQWLFKGERA